MSESVALIIPNVANVFTELNLAFKRHLKSLRNSMVHFAKKIQISNRWIFFSFF